MATGKSAVEPKVVSVGVHVPSRAETARARLVLGATEVRDAGPRSDPTKRPPLDRYDAVAGAIRTGTPYETALDPAPDNGPRHVTAEMNDASEAAHGRCRPRRVTTAGLPRGTAQCRRTDTGSTSCGRDWPARHPDTLRTGTRQWRAPLADQSGLVYRRRSHSRVDDEAEWFVVAHRGWGDRS